MTRFQDDDSFRSVTLVLAVLGTLAVLSFVMAGVVGAREKSPLAANAPITVPHLATLGK
jgi:hypothetical protein